VVARLKPGVTPTQGQAELTLLSARQAQTDHDLDGRTPRLQLLIDEMNRDGRRVLLPLFGASAFVFFIACGNTAALLLVRGLQRQQEYAVRTALGVGRAALFRQVSIESGAIAWPGGRPASVWRGASSPCSSRSAATRFRVSMRSRSDGR
jgi:putative ABC transport system permease protein